MSSQPGAYGSSASPTSPLFRTCMMSGGGEAARAWLRMIWSWSLTWREEGTPIGGGESMATWMSSRRSTRWVDIDGSMVSDEEVSEEEVREHVDVVDKEDVEEEASWRMWDAANSEVVAMSPKKLLEKRRRVKND